MTFPTEQEHFDAVKAALTATGANPADYSASPPATGNYSLVTVSDRFGGSARMSGQIGIRLARITVLYVGMTADNAREMRRRGEAALREQILTVAGRLTTPIEFETAEPIGEDGDANSATQWYSGRSQYIYGV